MTNDLIDLYEHRAGRAAVADDVATMLLAVRARAQQAQRARRSRLAIGGGVLVVAAVSAVTIGVGRGNGRPGGGIAPGVGSTHTSPAVSSSDAAASARQRAAAAQRAAERALRDSKRAESAARAAQSRTTLVPVPAAPDRAEISLGLAPQGFEYLSHDSADAYYGLPGTPDQPDSQQEIVAEVHTTLTGTNFPITVDGKPASYAVDGGYTSVRIRYDKTIDVGFQAPPSVHLTRSQALEIASSIDVRSTQHATEG